MGFPHRKNRAMGNLGHWEEKQGSDRRKAERTTRSDPFRRKELLTGLGLMNSELEEWNSWLVRQGSVQLG